MNNISLNIVANAQFQQVYAEVAKLKEAMASLQKVSVGGPFTPQVTASIKQAQSAFDSAVLSTRAFTIQHVAMTDSVTKFGKQLQAGQLSLNNYYKIWRDSAKGVSSELDNLATQQARLNRSVAVVDPLRPGYAKLVTDINGVVTAEEKAIFYQKALNTALHDGAMKMIDFGKNTQWMGRQLTVGLTMPLAMFGAAASQAFLNFDNQMTSMLKVYGAHAVVQSQATLDVIRKQVTDLADKMARTLGVAMADTVQIAKTFSSIGLEGQNLISATEATVKLQKLGDLTAVNAANSMVSLQNVFKLQATQVADAVNFLNAAKHSTSTTMQDITDALPRVGPIIQQMGGTYKDFVAFLVALKESGVPAAQGANAIKSMLASMINPTKAAQTALKSMHIDIKAIVAANQGNVMGMVQGLQQALNALPASDRLKAIEQTFGKFQFARVTALLNNLGTAGTQSAKVLELYGQSNAQLAAVAQQELDVASKMTPAAQFNKMKATLQADIIPLGRSFLQTMTQLGNIVDKIFSVFKNIGHALGPLAGILGKIFGGGLIGVLVIGPILMLTGLMANLAGNLLKGANYFRMFRQGMQEALPTENAFTAGLHNMRNFYENLDLGMVAARNQMDLMPESITSNAKAFDILSKSIADLTLQFDAFAIAQREAMGFTGGPSIAARLPGFATGVVGLPGSGSGDSIPAMLAPGESVITASATRKFGPMLSAMNNNSLPGFAEGVVGVTPYSFRRSTEVARLQEMFASDTALTDEIKQAIVSYLQTFVREGQVLKTSLQAVRDQIASLGLPGFEQTQLSTVGLSSRGGGASSLGARVPFSRALAGRPYELEAMRREQAAISAAAQSAGITNPDFYNPSRAHLLNLPKTVRGPLGSFNSNLWAGMAQVPNQMANMMVGQTGQGNKQVYLQALESSKAKELASVKGLENEEQQIVKIEAEYAALQQKVTKDLAATGNELITQNKVLDEIMLWSRDDKDKLQGITKNFLQYAEYTQIGVKARQDYYNELRAQGVAEKEIALIATRNVEELTLGVQQMYEQAISQGVNSSTLQAAIIEQSRLLGLNISTATIKGWEMGIAEAAVMQSPSKQTYEQGVLFVEGGLQGINSALPQANVAGHNLAEEVIAGANGSSTFLGMPAMPAGPGRLSNLASRFKGLAGSPFGIGSAAMMLPMLTNMIPNNALGAGNSGGVGLAKNMAMGGGMTYGMMSMMGPKLADLAGPVAGTIVAIQGLSFAIKKMQEDIRSSGNLLKDTFGMTTIATTYFHTQMDNLSNIDLSNAMMKQKQHTDAVQKNQTAIDGLTSAYKNATDQVTKDLLGQVKGMNQSQLNNWAQQKFGSDISTGLTPQQAMQDIQAIMKAAEKNNLAISYAISSLPKYANMGAANPAQGFRQTTQAIYGKYGEKAFDAQSLTSGAPSKADIQFGQYTSGLATQNPMILRQITDSLDANSKSLINNKTNQSLFIENISKENSQLGKLYNSLRDTSVSTEDMMKATSLLNAGLGVTADNIKAVVTNAAELQRLFTVASDIASLPATTPASTGLSKKDQATVTDNTKTIDANKKLIKTLQEEKTTRDNLYNAQMRNIDAQQAQMNIEAEAVKARGSGDLLALAVQQQNQQIQKTKDAMAAAKAAADVSTENRIKQLEDLNTALQNTVNGLTGKGTGGATKDSPQQQAKNWWADTSKEIQDSVNKFVKDMTTSYANLLKIVGDPKKAQEIFNAAIQGMKWSDFDANIVAIYKNLIKLFGEKAATKMIFDDIHVKLSDSAIATLGDTTGKKVSDAINAIFAAELKARPKHAAEIIQSYADFAASVAKDLSDPKLLADHAKLMQQLTAQAHAAALTAYADELKAAGKDPAKIAEIKARIQAMQDNLVNGISTNWNGGVKAVTQDQSMKAGIISFFKAIISLISDTLSWVFKTALNGFINTLKALNPMNLLSAIMKGTISSLFGFKDGGIIRAANGMMVGPGGPKSDMIPAMLSNGEYVVQAGAVSKYGKSFLDAVNNKSFTVPQSYFTAAMNSNISGAASTSNTSMNNTIHVYPPVGADANQVATLVINKINQAQNKMQTRRKV